MNKPNPHACTAFDMPFPTRGGEYVSTGRDIARVKPEPAQPPEALVEPSNAIDTESAARRGKKREESSNG
jgi:hypothetical protein